MTPAPILKNSRREPLTPRFDGAAYSAIQNHVSGVGVERSKLSHATAGQTRSVLSEAERIQLVEGDGVCRRLVFLYPDTAAMCWPAIVARDAAGFRQDEVQEYLRDLGGTALQDAIHEAAIEARWHGDGYILLGLDDGRGLSEPVDVANLKSFSAAKPIFNHEVIPQANSADPDYYEISAYRDDFSEFAAKPSFYMQRVHKDRILRIRGNRLVGRALELNQGRNQSALQVFYAGFADCYQGFASASNMLADYSVFVYTLKGLSNMIRAGKTDGLLKRFAAMQMGMSTVKGLMIDGSEESAEFINRSFGGVDKILQKLQESMVAAADIPWYKLIQSMKQGGLGGESGDEGQRHEWASMVESYQSATQRRQILRACRYAMLAQDGPTGGKVVPGIDLEFPSCLRLSPGEKVAQRKMMAEAHQINIDTGIYTPWEARSSSHGGPQFSLDVQLDQAISDKMETAAIASPAGFSATTARADGRSQLFTDDEYEELATVSMADFLQAARGMTDAD